MESMNKSIHEELSTAERSFKDGNYIDALQQVEGIASMADLSREDQLTCLLLESKIRVKLGEIEAARTLIEEVQEKTHEAKDLLLSMDALIIKAEICWRLGELNDGLEVVEEGQELLESIDRELPGIQEKEIREREGDLLRHGGILHWYKGDLNLSLDYHQRSLATMEALGDRKGIASSFNNLGLVYWSKGDLDQAIAYYQRCLAINEELGNKPTIAATLNNLGNAFSGKGDLDHALEHYQQSLLIKREFADNHEIAMTLTNIGAVYQLKGDLDQALDHYQKGLLLHEELGMRPDIALGLGNLGGIYQLKGELVLALEHNQRSLAIYEELGLKLDIARTLFNIGTIHMDKGDHKEASEFHMRSLELCHELENASLTSAVLCSLVNLALQHDDTSLARQHLQELEQIHSRTENRVIDQRYRVAKALSLKSSKRARHMVRAAEILEEVVEEEVADHSLTTTAMIHLCDLLVLELKATGEEQVFEAVKDLTNRLLGIAEEQSSQPLLAETTLLQSKLALVELDVEQAKELLTKAQNITEEKGLHLLARKVAQEQDLLQSQMQKWERIVQQKPSRQEMIDVTQLDVLLERMIHKTVAVLTDEEKAIVREDATQKKYKLVYLDRLKEPEIIERNSFRVGIAQIGLSQTGDILQEFYRESGHGLFGLREDMVESVRSKVINMVEKASHEGIDLLLFPELTIDLNHLQLRNDVLELAQTHKMHIVPGSYHDPTAKRNISLVISPQDILWEQEKHIPAMIHFEGERMTEGIETRSKPRKVMIGTTEFGRIAICICRDFLDMDLRVELKNAEPPVDVILNPAFTPVTADFKAAHFDARRSIYAYCFFANVAEFGESFIYTPEKERVERNIPAGEENLIYKDVDLFQLRSERKKWEIEQRKTKSFIQSTR
jgi:tetratricopeptide (TPR) repeat protein/predicted amidohydrolase